MKRIYSIAFVAGVIFSAASCQKEIANEPLQNGGDFTITATTVADTKTVLDDANKLIYWAPGDKISVFDATNNDITFSTDIAATATTAKFTNNVAFTAPESLVAVYPDRDGLYEFDGTTVSNFRVGATQTAVAGSFDSSMAGAIGLPVSEGSTELQFTSVHALIKFTIGGDIAPSEVTLVNNKYMIAGLYNYNLSTGKVENTGSQNWTKLTGSFEVGKTYYIAVIPYGSETTLTLKFGDTEVKTSKTVTLEPNKIYNMGTVKYPDAPALTATRLWVKTFAELGLSANGARNCATDGEYVFVPNSASSPAAVKAFPVNGGAAIDVNMTGVSGGTHATSCVRMIENNNASINGGKDILVLCNLGSSETLKLYAYTNGINSAPEVIELINTWRRLGDKFTYVGEWNNGQFRFPDWNSNAAIVYFTVENGIFTGGYNDAGQAWPNSTYSVPSFSGITEFVTYPDAAPGSSYSLLTNTGFGYCLNNLAQSEWGTNPNLAMTFGYNFFEFNGAKYIAYARLNSNKKNGSLNVIVDKGSAAEFKNTLEAQSKILTVPVLDAESGITAGSSVCDCDVYVDAEGNAFAAVLIDNCGLAYFQLTEATAE